MAIDIKSKEYITKCGLIKIIKELLDKNLIEEEDRHALQFCLDQHNYKLIEGQENGFDKSALFDTFQTLGEVFGFDVEYEDMLNYEFH